METVDVLIPYYNDSDGFARTLASIQAQTVLPQLRIVVVDDGSAAEHAYRLAQLLDQSGVPHRLITNKVNSGRPYTRNVLLDCMDGDYVAWLDSGDEWFADKTEKQLAALKSAGATKDSNDFWATCSYEWREAGKTPRQITQQTDGDVTQALLIGKHLRAYLWTMLAPTPAMRSAGYFDEALLWLEDLDFILRFVDTGGRLIQPINQSALSIYYKEHSNRGAKMIDQSYEHLFAKHSRKYLRYGRDFKMKCQRDAKDNCIRFAKADGDERLRKKLKRQKKMIKMKYYGGFLNLFSKQAG